MRQCSECYFASTKMSKLCLINSFANKKKLSIYNKPSFLGVGGRVPEKQEVSSQINSRIEAFDCLMFCLILEGFFTRR